MNNKISKFQISMFLALICSSLYLGLSNIILLRKSGNEVLISMIVGTILGLIPIFMYLKINSSLPKLNIYQKNISLFGKFFGNIINILYILIYIVMLIIATRSIIVFVTSKYLLNTPYIFVGLLVIITCLIICFKGLETIARVSQLMFIASLLFIIIIEISLIQFIEIKNILPLFSSNNYIFNIIDGAIYHVGSVSLLTMLLLAINKSKIKDQKNYNITIISFYLLTSLLLTIVMSFVISCFGYNLASLFRYPEYILLKKINISSSELHLENLLAFRWIFYAIALVNISLYGIICGIKNYIKKVKLSNMIIIIIAVVCIIIGDTVFKYVPKTIILVKDYYIPFIAIPMFLILLITFIKCLFLKKESKN